MGAEPSGQEMKLGVDIRVMGKNRAVAKYTRGLIKALAKANTEVSFVLFTDDQQKAKSLGGDVLGRSLLRLVSSKLTLRDHFLFRRSWRDLSLDIFLHPDNVEFLFCHPNSVVALHDVIPYLYPELSLSGDRLIALRQKLYLFLQKTSLQRSAKMVLTVSEFSKSEIIRVLGLDPETVFVTHEGIDSNFQPIKDPSELERVRVRYRLPEKYLFYLGGFDGRKNVLRLIHAFSRLAEEFSIHLVLGGGLKNSVVEGGSEFLALKKEIQNLGVSSLVVFTDFIEESDLPAVYSGAKVFVYPSLCEGFGLPPLEAQSCGVPVVSSNATSLPEICLDSAILVNPRETQEIYSAISLLLEGEGIREKYSAKGLENVRRFTWESCARKTLAAFQNL